MKSSRTSDCTTAASARAETRNLTPCGAGTQIRQAVETSPSPSEGWFGIPFAAVGHGSMRRGTFGGRFRCHAAILRENARHVGSSPAAVLRAASRTDTACSNLLLRPILPPPFDSSRKLGFGPLIPMRRPAWSVRDWLAASTAAMSPRVCSQASNAMAEAETENAIDIALKVALALTSRRMKPFLDRRCGR